MAEDSPNGVTKFNYSQRKVVIGRIYFHEDGTLCDETIYKLQKLSKPVFLHLGDSTRDPRV